MKKTMNIIVSAIMAVSMTGGASVNAQTVRGTDNNGISNLVTTAKKIKENPALTCLGPLEIDGMTWRYTAKMVNGKVSVRLYEWTGIETLTQPLAEAIS